MNEHEHDEGWETEISPKLAEHLHGIHNRPVLVPQQIEAAILAKSRQHLKLVAKERRFVHFVRWLAAAAAIALGVFVSSLWFPRHHAPSPVAREDIDHNGHIDILDAFSLARRIGQGEATAPQFDINGDGVLDRRDIDAIGAQAVKLEPRKG